MYFFQKTLDAETDASTPPLVELQNTVPLEGVQIISEIPPDAQITVSVPWHPPPGNYLITVYVDMPSVELPKGSIVERLERIIVDLANLRVTGSSLRLKRGTR